MSQFTLLARTKKGTKPDFHGAANPEDAKRLYEYFVSAVKKEYDPARVADGRFQAMMEVALVNDGPVSFCHEAMFMQNALMPLKRLLCFPSVTKSYSLVCSIGYTRAECRRQAARGYDPNLATR